MNNNVTIAVWKYLLSLVVAIFIPTVTLVSVIYVNQAKLEYFNNDLEKKVDNNVLIEYIKYNNRTLDYLIDGVDANTKALEKLEDELHEFELKHIGEEITRSSKKKSEARSDGTLITLTNGTQSTITKYTHTANLQ